MQHQHITHQDFSQEEILDIRELELAELKAECQVLALQVEAWKKAYESAMTSIKNYCR